MSNNLKTNMVELKGKKIYALDPRMGLINRYFCLWSLSIQFPFLIIWESFCNKSYNWYGIVELAAT